MKLQSEWSSIAGLPVGDECVNTGDGLANPRRPKAVTFKLAFEIRGAERWHLPRKHGDGHTLGIPGYVKHYATVGRELNWPVGFFVTTSLVVVIEVRSENLALDPHETRRHHVG